MPTTTTPPPPPTPPPPASPVAMAPTSAGVPTTTSTGLLSRRWLGLWTRLADLAFRTDAAGKIEVALACFSSAAAWPVASSIRISFPVTPREPSPLLRAAALLSPAELVLVLREEPRQAYGGAVVLPSFHRATSIEIDAGLHGIRPPPAGEFPALESLSLAGNIAGLGALLGRYPRLRVLAVTFRGVDPESLDAELAALEPAATARGLEMSLFGVHINTRHRHGVDAARFHRLLCTAARLSAQKLVFTHEYGRDTEAAHLPNFHRATSIELDVGLLSISPPPSGDFPVKLDEVLLCLVVFFEVKLV